MQFKCTKKIYFFIFECKVGHINVLRQERYAEVLEVSIYENCLFSVKNGLW